MEFICKLSNDHYTEWKSKIISFTDQGSFFEENVEGRGSAILIIFGMSKHGNFICLPDYKTGCYLAHLRDTFWNSEALEPLIGEVDATTVAYALRALQETYFS